MKIKTIVVDLDRTLLHTDKTLSAYTVDVLKECRRRGMGIMVATARPLRDVSQFSRIIGFDALTVSNGARVICGGECTDHGISQNSAERLLRYLSRYPELRITLETGRCAYSNKPVADYETVLSNDLLSVAQREGALKLLVHLDSEGTRALVEQELTADLYSTVAHGYLMQIMSRAATKWNGVRAMLEISGCIPAETAYFGDDHDDVEAIRLCGMGVAVSNGIEEARAAADYVAGSNDADGVAAFIEKMILV